MPCVITQPQPGELQHRALPNFENIFVFFLFSFFSSLLSMALQQHAKTYDLSLVLCASTKRVGFWRAESPDETSGLHFGAWDPKLLKKQCKVYHHYSSILFFSETKTFFKALIPQEWLCWSGTNGTRMERIIFCVFFFLFFFFFACLHHGVLFIDLQFVVTKQFHRSWYLV